MDGSNSRRIATVRPSRCPAHARRRGRFSTTGTSGRRPPAATRTSPPCRPDAAAVCQGRIGEAAPAGAGTRQALLPQHPRRVQTFDNDPAVGLGQPCCQDVEVVGADIVDPAMQPGYLCAALTVAPRAFGATRPCPAQLAAALSARLPAAAGSAPARSPRPQRWRQWPGRRTPTSTPTRESGSARRGLLRAPDRTRTPASRPGARCGAPSRQYPRPPWQISRSCGGCSRGPGRCRSGQGEVPAVGFDPDRAGGEGHPVAVAALLRNRGNPTRLPGPVPGTGGLPVPVGVHRALMPSANASLLISGHHTWPVSASTHSSSLTLFQRFRSPAATGLAVSLAGLPGTASMSAFRVRDRPVAGVPAATEMPPHARRLLRGQSSANRNACTVQPSGTSNLAITTPARRASAGWRDSGSARCGGSFSARSGLAPVGVISRPSCRASCFACSTSGAHRAR